MSDDYWTKVEIDDKYEVTKHLKEEMLRARREFGKGSGAELEEFVLHIVNAIYSLEQRIVDGR